jgi:hypothetical protein
MGVPFDRDPLFVLAVEETKPINCGIWLESNVASIFNLRR